MLISMVFLSSCGGPKVDGILSAKELAEIKVLPADKDVKELSAEEQAKTIKMVRKAAEFYSSDSFLKASLLAFDPEDRKMHEKAVEQTKKIMEKSKEFFADDNKVKILLDDMVPLDVVEYMMKEIKTAEIALSKEADIIKHTKASKDKPKDSKEALEAKAFGESLQREIKEEIKKYLNIDDARLDHLGNAVMREFITNLAKAQGQPIAQN